MQAEEILKMIEKSGKYFIAGYFKEAMDKGIKTVYHLRELSEAEAKHVAKAVFEKLLGEELGGL